ncbi:MAG: hypothetical protein LBJ44_00555 [Propionibacteriaceae bacterium]|nr:hypothetical protein [Propionibacteriaceae bacterium]
MLIGVGVAGLALSEMSFLIRAAANKQAWNGPTRPFLLIGLVSIVAGLVTAYFAFR